jgi:membrane protease YdiL (CAAX protease family)
MPACANFCTLLFAPATGAGKPSPFFFWPVMLLFPATIVHLLHGPLVKPQSHGALWMSAAYGGVAFLNAFLFTAALEETGWRGFLLPHLQQRFSPILASLLVWLPWAFWHAPLDFHRPFRFTLIQYILIRVVFLIPITIILTWLYNRSSGNLLTVAIFHAAMNTFPFVLPYSPPALGLVFVFAAAIIISDRMWRLRTVAPRAPLSVPAAAQPAN